MALKEAGWLGEKTVYVEREVKYSWPRRLHGSLPGLHFFLGGGGGGGGRIGR